MATDITMNDLLQATIDEGASDLHVRAYMPPKLRIHGELVAIADESFDKLKDGVLKFMQRDNFQDFTLALRSAGFRVL